MPETLATTLTVISCGECHIPFAIPTHMHADLVRTGSRFYCPNGHNIRYADTENNRLQAQVERLSAQKDFWSKETERARASARLAERRAAAARGQVTKIKNRIAKGACPVPGCKRSGFEHTALVRHLHDMHPTFVIPEEH